jgi:PKD repeat protein
MNKILIILVLSLQSVHVFSQCQTDYYNNEAKKANAQILETQKAFLSNVPQVSAQSKRATKFIIPVVFHVIHTNGPENISKAQIESQIKVLNQDFSLNNPNRTAIRSVFKNIASDCEIEFRLAKIDPQGNCTDGINRVYSPLHVQARDNVKSISGARWPNNKYLNIWTVSSIKENGTTGGTTLGYAYLPYSISGGLSNLDGIVVRADYTGVVGTGSVSGAGRTLTHEIGHYLGLLHTFEGGCAGTGTGGDYCEDTPPVEETFTNASCPSNGNSCHTETPDLIDQWENYMDYSTGTCQSMFSVNQKSIMQGVLTNSNTMAFRKNMVSEANLIATGVMDGGSSPVAFFYSSARTVCVGQAVSFYDISCKAEVTSKQWTLPGASISNTNIDTPIVTYKTPGKYKVTLKVMNGSSNNTLAVDNYITVLPATAIDKPTIVQDFESPTWNIGTGWGILDAGAVKFTRDTTSTAYRGNSCIVAPITSTLTAGQRFQLVTPPLDLRSLKGKTPKISMMVAYQKKSSTSSEELRFYHSRGCENNNWSQFLFRNAAFISYTTAFSSTFKPTSANQWKLITFNLTSFENDSNISFMIEVVGNQGNPVYIDAINIGQYTTGISDIEKEISLNVYPNPSNGELTIDYENTSGETEVWLENIEGKRICTVLEKTAQTGEITVRYHTLNMIPDGLYILKIKSNEQIINKKVIFAN